MQDTKTFGFLKPSLTGIPDIVIKPVKQAKTSAPPTTLATNSSLPDKVSEGKTGNAATTKSNSKVSNAKTAAGAAATTTGGGVRRKAKEANKKKSIAAKKVS